MQEITLYIAGFWSILALKAAKLNLKSSYFCIEFFIFERKVDTMQRKIKLSVDEVENFVKAACNCKFDIDISYNRYVVDAKSILGVYGLDMTKVLTVNYDGYDAEFENCLKQLAIAS